MNPLKRVVAAIAECLIPGQAVAAALGRDYGRVDDDGPQIDYPLIADSPGPTWRELADVDGYAVIHHSPWSWQNIAAKAPNPTLVDSLGVDEQDSMWRSDTGTYWRWTDGRWWHSDDRKGWTGTPPGYIVRADRPYMKVLDSPLGWLGWAVPAILEVLAEHTYVDSDPGECLCEATGVQDVWDWRQHVAYLIAERIGCDPARAIDALTNYTPEKVD